MVTGLTLYHSLATESSKPFVLWVLCLDVKTKETLDAKGLSNIRTISLVELEDADPELLSIKVTRTLVEYYFTCTPCLPWYILKNNENIDDITYLDSDLFFFSDPEEIYQAIGENSIAITPHRPSKQHKEKIKWGIYNVGFNYFRRNNSGLECLNWWREKCIEWCFDKIEGEKYADQGYLNDWPESFSNVKVLENPEINLAPWNLQDCIIEYSQERVLVNGKKLIFFHFHALKYIGDEMFKPCWENYNIKPSRVLLKYIYQKYINVFYTFELQNRYIININLDHPRVGNLIKKKPSGKIAILYQKLKKQILIGKITNIVLPKKH